MSDQLVELVLSAIAYVEKITHKFIPEATVDQKEDVYETLDSGSRPSSDYFIMVSLSAIIATVGLLINSPAIIIGAMLVAPLMLPILSISLASVKGDLRLFWRAFEAEAKGMIFAVFIAFIIAYLLNYIIPLTSIPSEIALRTEPTSLDLFVALASGAAGAYALSRGLNATLPGVAIATAVLPPLSVMGIGLGVHRPELALGGFTLFLSNAIAINFAGSVVFWLVGFNPKWSATAEKETARRLLISLALLLIISIPLAFFLYTNVTTESTKSTIERVITEDIGVRSELVSATSGIDPETGVFTVTATILSPNEYEKKDTSKLREKLVKELNRPLNLNLNVLVFQSKTATVQNSA